MSARPAATGDRPARGDPAPAVSCGPGNCRRRSRPPSRSLAELDTSDSKRTHGHTFISARKTQLEPRMRGDCLVGPGAVAPTPPSSAQSLTGDAPVPQPPRASEHPEGAWLRRGPTYPSTPPWMSRSAPPALYRPPAVPSLPPSPAASRRARAACAPSGVHRGGAPEAAPPRAQHY